MTHAVTRFAPSPSGRLHLGHAFSATLAHDRARGSGGSFLLRIDDIDGTRSRAEYVTAALEDLDWLGLRHDGPPVYQSDRLADYAAALDDLQRRGLVYRCFCTRADIAASQSAPHGPAGPVYPGTCRYLADAAVPADRDHCWRLDMARAVADAGPLDWIDERLGPRNADPLAHGDVVLARKDAPASYHLASTLDDAALGITHVVRGADLIAATDVHVLLQSLLGLPRPVYWHHPLVVDAAGHRLAKRDRATELAALRAAGVDGRQLADDLRAMRFPSGYSLSNT